MKVLVFCNKGFETMELAPFIDVFGWARDEFHYDVDVVTCGFTRTVVSTFNVPIMVDITIDKIKPEEYDALAIPGGFEGYGYFEEAYDERFLELIRKFDAKRKPIACICVGALPVGKSGVLVGRNATTYHLSEGHRQRQLSEFGAKVIPDQRIVVDSNIVTSFCPETAADVAFHLLSQLIGNEKTKNVSHAMGYSSITQMPPF